MLIGHLPQTTTFRTSECQSFFEFRISDIKRLGTSKGRERVWNTIGLLDRQSLRQPPLSTLIAINISVGRKSTASSSATDTEQSQLHRKV